MVPVQLIDKFQKPRSGNTIFLSSVWYDHAVDIALCIYNNFCMRTDIKRALIWG